MRGQARGLGFIRGWLTEKKKAEREGEREGRGGLAQFNSDRKTGCASFLLLCEVGCLCDDPRSSCSYDTSVVVQAGDAGADAVRQREGHALRVHRTGPRVRLLLRRVAERRARQQVCERLHRQEG